MVVAPSSGRPALRHAAELLEVERLALADPEAVPAGVYAKEWLESEGLWSQVAGRVVPTLDVRAALAAVVTGLADAGIVYATDAATAPESARVVFSVEDGPPITYVSCQLSATTELDALARHLRGGAARDRFVAAGFTPLF